MFKPLYAGGKKRAITFSFDDGFSQDVRLIGLLNKYGLKATFNLNGHHCNNGCFLISEGGVNYWDGSNYMKACFNGHEVASHTLTHPHLLNLTAEEHTRQITEDVKILSKAIGYKTEGFAPPYGIYNAHTVESAKQCGIKYIRDLSEDDTFALPDDFYKWKVSGHITKFLGPDGKAKLTEFLNTATELPCLNMWGHSYEFTNIDCYNKANWHEIRDRFTAAENEIFKKISGIDDVWYATNIEICKYITDLRQAVVTNNGIENPTSSTLFFEHSGRVIKVAPHSKYGA